MLRVPFGATLPVAVTIHVEPDSSANLVSCEPINAENSPHYSKPEKRVLHLKGE